jgi:membrane protein DedA with SNARE-associated domain
MSWLPILRMRPLTFLHEPLAGLISLQTLQNALSVWGYPAVTLFIMIESAGIPFPGETMLLLASFSAATIDPQLNIVIIIACAAFGAIIGDNAGYYIGRTGGRAFVERFGRYVFVKPRHLDYAEKFFEKHGDKTVFFGRFIAILRTWAAFLAGVNHMRWRNFLIYNAAGGIAWAIVYGTLGYVAGRVFHDNFAQVEKIAGTTSWIGAGAIVVLAVLIFIMLRLRHRRKMARLSTTNATSQAEQSRDRTASSKDEPTSPQAMSTDNQISGGETGVDKLEVGTQEEGVHASPQSPERPLSS